jgi:hypothetical protein
MTALSGSRIKPPALPEVADYIIKFSSDNPRNPANQAGKEELKIIEMFNNNPKLKRWNGIISIGGKPYMSKFSARRLEPSCLRCHGNPADLHKIKARSKEIQQVFFHKTARRRHRSQAFHQPWHCRKSRWKTLV